MKHVKKILLGGSLAIFMAGVIGWPATHAGNRSIAPPPPPPKAGTTLELSGGLPLITGVQVMLAADLRNNHPDTPALVEFTVVEGLATIGDKEVRSSNNGHAVTKITARGTGKVVVRATCRTAGCSDELILEAKNPE